MISRLRLKFVAVNMALVSVVLVIVFSSMCMTECNRLHADTDRALDQMMLAQGFTFSRPIIDRVGETTVSAWRAAELNPIVIVDENGGNVYVNVVEGVEGRSIAVYSSDIPTVTFRAAVPVDETSEPESSLVLIGSPEPAGSEEPSDELSVNYNLSAVRAMPAGPLDVSYAATKWADAESGKQSNIPAFWVLTDADGNLLHSMLESVEITDEVMLAALDQALSAEEDSGVLDDFALKYRRGEFHGSTKVAFADMTAQTTGIRSSVFKTIAAFVASLAAFFVVSLILSAWVIRPVERSWNEQRRFVADASHELKTPLTVILANTGILLEHRSERIADHENWIDSTRFEALRMKALIENMLFLARGDSSGNSVANDHITTFSLSDLVWHAVLSFEPVAYEMGTGLLSDIVPNVEVTSDRTAVEKLLGLLLDNAVKYSGEGGRVDVALSASPPRLTVKNTGEPIPPDSLPHIFERFYRADPARPEGGHGLGLSIAKAIADANKIKLSASSDADSGTVFTAEF